LISCLQDRFWPAILCAFQREYQDAQEYRKTDLHTTPAKKHMTDLTELIKVAAVFNKKNVVVVLNYLQRPIS